MRTFASYHPVVTFTYFAVVITLTMFVSNPMILMLSLSGGVALSLILLNKKSFKTSLYFMIPMFLLVVLTNPLFSHQGITVLFNLGRIPVTFESILYGMGIAGMLAAVIFWFNCFNKIVTGDKLMFLFGRVLPKISLILSTALKFIPYFKKHIESILAVQRVTGIHTENGTGDKLKGVVRATSSVIQWSLENSVDTADSMKARGYCVQKRSSYASYKFKGRDLRMLIIIFIFSGITLTGAAMGALDFNYYPALTKISLDALSVFSYTAFLLLAILPVLSEIKEHLTWKYSVSKI